MNKLPSTFTALSQRPGQPGEMTPRTILAFDIETIPDVAGLRRLHALPDTLHDADVVAIIQRQWRQKKGGDFLPLHLHRVAAISCVLRQFENRSEPLKIFSLPSCSKTDEKEAVQIFFRLIDKYQPTLVSWNGGGFDLPVLQYRAMQHRLQAATYLRSDGDFKWDNYTNRFHERHTDLMDVLGMYQMRGAAPLDDFAILCNLPGKIGIGGSNVWGAWQKGELAAIRRYCENDALLTYLLYVRYQHFRARLDGVREEIFIREQLESEGGYWREFLTRWRDDNAPEDKNVHDDGGLLL